MADETGLPGEISTFIDDIGDERRLEESKALLSLPRSVTGEEPVLSGSSVVGFGPYHYRYASGRERDGYKVGFAPWHMSTRSWSRMARCRGCRRCPRLRPERQADVGRTSTTA